MDSHEVRFTLADSYFYCLDRFIIKYQVFINIFASF